VELPNDYTNRWERVAPRHTTIEEVNEDLYKSNLSNLPRPSKIPRFRITNLSKKDIKSDDKEESQQNNETKKSEIKQDVSKDNVESLLTSIVIDSKLNQNNK
jgi:predicted Fe-Mo cluster-binding NifX family protein